MLRQDPMVGGMPRDVGVYFFRGDKPLGVRVVFGDEGYPVIPVQKDFAAADVVRVGVVPIDAQQRERRARPYPALAHIVADVFICFFDVGVYIIVDIIVFFCFKVPLQPCEHIRRSERRVMPLVKIHVWVRRALYILPYAVKNGVELHRALRAVAVYPTARRVIFGHIYSVHVKIVFI